MKRIYITVEGGIVQGVTSDDPAVIDAEVFIIDHDTDGVDVATLSKVRQPDGSEADAYIWRTDVEKAEIAVIGW